MIIEDNDGMIYILNLSSKPIFTIGRGHDCDVKLSEITVSRKHMKLSMDTYGNIRISDFNSKFGTLI